MQKLTCDGEGCRKSESLSTPDSRRTIKRIKLHVINDSRESIPQGQDHYTTDLCPECLGHMLNRFFVTPQTGALELRAAQG